MLPFALSIVLYKESFSPNCTVSKYGGNILLRVSQTEPSLHSYISPVYFPA